MEGGGGRGGAGSDVSPSVTEATPEGSDFEEPMMLVLRRGMGQVGHASAGVSHAGAGIGHAGAMPVLVLVMLLVVLVMPVWY